MKVRVYIEAENEDEREHLTTLLIEEGVASVMTDLDALADSYVQEIKEVLQYSAIRLKESTILLESEDD